MTRPLAPLLALAAALLAGAAVAASASAEPLKILPIGDSLTKGIGSTHRAGYRLEFLARMKAAGVDVDMVGSFHDGPKEIDRDHQGHQGQGVAKLDSVSLEELRRERPNAVILMIGTNDAKEKSLVPEAFRIRYSVLLDRILAESHVKLVVATIPPTRFGRKVKLIQGINAIITSEVEKRIAAGKSIRLVDVYSLVDNRADFVDNLHMNDAGYAKVGDAFADALLELIDKPAAASTSVGAAAP
jgi:lysophospholipase L1-like esterase